MGNQFLSSLEVMTSCSQCPTVLLDAETVSVHFLCTSHLKIPVVLLHLPVYKDYISVIVCNNKTLVYLVNCQTVCGIAGFLWAPGDSEVQCVGVTRASGHLQQQERSSRTGEMLTSVMYPCIILWCCVFLFFPCISKPYDVFE